MIPLPKQRSDQWRQTLMDEDIPLPFDLPAVARKKVSAAFDGGAKASRRNSAITMSPVSSARSA